jgi:hypothetical protein
MRPIKFRAWTLEKKMEYNAIPINSEKIVGDNGPYGVPSQPAKVMQFTGLKDKNGKEIYEGDIVKGVINKKQDTWVIDMSDLYWHESPKGLSFKNKWVQFGVIGNIYENPELMEKSK